MRKLSNAFKEQQNNGVAKYLKYIDITLTDGTELHLTNDDLWDNGFKLEDAVSSGTEFEIGSAIVNQCTININNIENEFSCYAFEGAEVTCYVGLRISPSGLEDTKTIPWKDIDGTSILDVNGSEILLEYDDAYIEKIRMCTMTVVDAPYQNDSIINLTCQDDMRKFDKNYSRSRLQYPATRAQIIRDACDVCGVQLHTQTFDNDDYIVSERPDDEGLTFRQVLAWTAQIGCQWLRCNEYGELCVGWYNEKTEAEEISQTNGYTINLESVVITGIKVTEYLEASTEEDKAGTYMYGNDGYVLGITGNKLIPKGAGDTVATMIGQKCVGLTFRPFQANRYTDIAYEAGDPVLVRDKDGKPQRSYLTQVTTQPGRLQQIECNAKSAERNSSQRYSASTQAIIAARKAAKKQVEHYDQKVEQITKLIGQGFGMYITGVKQDDGSTIYYMHDKPNLKESGYTCYWTTNGIIASLDGGTTWAIDRNGNALFNTITARGINANWINTGEFKVTDENGNEVFYVNCDTGIVRINAQTFAITGQSVADIAKKQLQNFVDEVYNIDIEKLKEQISNKIETWTQEEDPSLAWGKITEIIWRDIDGHPILDVDGNEIIVKCEETKAEHEGDLWYNPVTKEKWIYQSGNWVPEDIPDKIFDEIDGKSSIYINTPVPPYKERDVYFTGSTILVCKTARSAGAYNADDWGKKDGYTDDSTVNNFIKDTYTPKISDLQKQIDGKVDTYFYDYEPTLSNVPASAWTTDELKTVHNGDLFFWKTKGYTYRFLKIDSVWQWFRIKDSQIDKAMNDASNAQDTADSKRRVFVTTPAPPYDVGDLWTQGKSGDLMRCKVAKASGAFATTDWEKAVKYTDDSAVDDLDAALTQEDIFNRLTNNGKAQGIYIENGDLYVNATYIKSGKLTLGGKNNEHGTLEIIDNSGKVIGAWDNDGIDVKNGTITSKSGSDVASLRNGKLWVYNSGTSIGSVGKNEMSGYPNSTGLVFDLDNDASYMAWAAADSAQSLYSVKLLYAHKSFSHYTAGRLYLGCDLDCDGSNIRNARLLDSIYIPNGTDVDCYSDVDMHNWSLKNVDLDGEVSAGGYSTFSGTRRCVYKMVNGTYYWTVVTVKNGLIVAWGEEK